MADTQRSKSAILALLADNTTGEISPQDLRDTVVSLTPGHGAVYMTSTTATTIATAGTYTKALGTTTLNSDPMNFSMPANNRLRYDGTADAHMHVACSITYSANANNQTLGFQLWKYDDSGASGALLAHSEIRDESAASGKLSTTALHADVQMSTNDYLELYLTNETTTNTVTVDKMYMFALAMFQ